MLQNTYFTGFVIFMICHILSQFLNFFFLFMTTELLPLNLLCLFGHPWYFKPVICGCCHPWFNYIIFVYLAGSIIIPLVGARLCLIFGCFIYTISPVLGKDSKITNGIFPGRERNWAVYYTSPQCFIKALSYLLRHNNFKDF